MILVLVLASIFSYRVLGSPSPIVGGEFTLIKEFPWVASIQRNGYHMCGGTIISDKVILTAAHCVFDYSPDSLIVRVGSSRTDSGGTWHNVVAIKTHEDFGTLLGDLVLPLYDVALLRLASHIQFAGKVTQIKLAKKGSKVMSGIATRVAGWGADKLKGSPIMELRSAKLKVIDNAACARAYGDKKGSKISSSYLICAAEEGRDTCSGDSGGPLINQDDVQIGIVSVGLGCADRRYPGIYTDVAHYREWIDTNSRLSVWK